LRDRLSDDQNAKDLFQWLLGKFNDWRIGSLVFLPMIEVNQFSPRAILTEVRIGLAIKSVENINKALFIFSTIKFV
jgi:hypothetical protein